MDQQTPLRILCLDGGGIRGISSLYILKELMAQIERDRLNGTQFPPPAPLRPCDIFDLICGTSTGGLIALMLGRLEMVSSHKVRRRQTLTTGSLSTKRLRNIAISRKKSSLKRRKHELRNSTTRSWRAF